MKKLIGTVLAFGLAASPMMLSAGGVGGGNANSNWTIYGWQNWAIDFRSVETTSARSADGMRERDIIKMENEAANIGFAASIDTGMSMGGTPIKANFQCEQFTFHNRNSAFSHNSWCTRNSKLGLSGPWGEFMVSGWLTPYNEVTAQWIDPFYDAGSHTHSTLLGLVGFGTNYGNSGFDGTGYEKGVGGQGFMRRKANLFQWFSPPTWGGLHVRVGWSNDYNNGGSWFTDEVESSVGMINMAGSSSNSAGRVDPTNDAQARIYLSAADYERYLDLQAIRGAFSSGTERDTFDSRSHLHNPGNLAEAPMAADPDAGTEAVPAIFWNNIAADGSTPLDDLVNVTTAYEVKELNPEILSIGASYTAKLGNDELWIGLGYQQHDEWAAAAFQCADSDDQTIRYAVRYIKDWGNGHSTRLSLAYEDMEYDWENCRTDRATAAANGAVAGPFDFTKTNGMVDFERDAWLVSGKHDFPGPLDFRFMYMEADDFECGESMMERTPMELVPDWGSAEAGAVMMTGGEMVEGGNDCGGINEKDSGATAFSVGLYYTFPAGTELRLVYGEVDNDDNSQNGFGINSSGVRMGGKEESWQIGMVQWF